MGVTQYEIRNTPMTDFTTDELIIACISRQIVDGEVLAQGIATPLVAAGYILAKCTHAPNVMFASAIGQSLCQDWAPLGVARIESLWLDKAIVGFGFARAATEVLPRLAPKEFFRPGQMDRHGNFNNVAIDRPRMRLPGTGGGDGRRGGRNWRHGGRGGAGTGCRAGTGGRIRRARCGRGCRSGRRRESFRAGDIAGGTVP